jgi:hypothetical protein
MLFKIQVIKNLNNEGSNYLNSMARVFAIALKK